MSEVFISVDVEAAGPIPSEYSLLSIGACDVRDDSVAFECLVKPINGNFDPKALEVTGLKLEELDRVGLQGHGGFPPVDTEDRGSLRTSRLGRLQCRV